MKFEEINEYTLIALAEKATMELDKKELTVFPDIEQSDRKFKHGGMRIKVNKGHPTTDTSVTSSFPINTSGPFPTINEKKIKYGAKLSKSDESLQLKAAKAAVAYAFDELDKVYKDPSTENVKAYEDKISRFNDLSDAEKKAYIKMGSEK